MKVIYAVLCCLAAAQQCPKFVCSPPNVKWPVGACGTLNSTNHNQVFLNVGYCPAGEYCNFFAYGDSNCAVIPGQQQPRALPGEPCDEDNLCATRTCEKGTCNALPKFSPCSIFYDCGLDNICHGGICYPMSRIGGQCESSWDCVQNAGCDALENEPAGTCVGYLSLEPGKPVRYCAGAAEGVLGYNEFCASTNCFQSPKDNAYYCAGTVYTNGTVPVNCNNATCTSTRDPFSSYVAHGQCLCSYDGNAYCALYSGDEIKRTFLNGVKEVLRDPRFLTCNSVGNDGLPVYDNSYCVQTIMKATPKMIAEYYLGRYWNYAVNAEDCVVQTLMPQFFNATRGYNVLTGRP